MANPLATLALLLCCALPAPSLAAETIRPAWAELSTPQREVLAPLAPQWNVFSAEQRKRWIALADRYPKMTAAEQKRVQERMREWAKLTPQQREAARARYRALSKLNPEQRRAIVKQWTESQEAQQALPEPPAEALLEPTRAEDAAAAADKPAAPQ
jgi:hypothetical protein